ncbi:MAG: c-type cytochrome [Candidatus Dechloromonas phosphoritropha]
MKLAMVAVGVSVVVCGGAQAEGKAAAGIAIRNYPPNTPPTERDDALKLEGHSKAGHKYYTAYCEACHLPSGAGNRDGSIPQLAGQHQTVLVKQLADIRSGVRYNPTMYPFARKLPNAQALADVAAYIETLCLPHDSGKYEGPDAARQIADGKPLFDNQCAKCHQPNGGGSKEALYPVLAGQHYKYLLRQMTDVRDGRRVDVPTEMFDAITKYDNAQLVAVAAYQASLKTPGLLLCRNPTDKAKM